MEFYIAAKYVLNSMDDTLLNNREKNRRVSDIRGSKIIDIGKRYMKVYTSCYGMTANVLSLYITD